MEQILDHFKKITAIPRCSFNASGMKKYIHEFAVQLGYDVQEDHAGNVLCRKGNPKICLQAHYDMVCIGDTSSIEILHEGNLLKAKSSTLGADNGIGMAIMFWAMQMHDHLECLFTADEEVGLIGASAFRLPLVSKALVNLDAEEEGEIYIGCAGGVDSIASLPLHYMPLDEEMNVYEIWAEDFLGGHSGVDIDKKIPSAIKCLGHELAKHPDLVLISLEGGERRNAIASGAKAIVGTKKSITCVDSRLHVKRLEKGLYHSFIAQSSDIIAMIVAFAQGIREWDRTLGIPSVSVNLGTVGIENKRLNVVCALRAMNDSDLDILSNEISTFFKAYGFCVEMEGWHGAWSPCVTPFVEHVKTVMSHVYHTVSVKAIHAGLECGELIAHQSHEIEAVSIGPTIRFPHSLREECEVSSIGNVAQIVQNIINTYEG